MSDAKHKEQSSSPASQSALKPGLFTESLALMDDNTWIWSLVQYCFNKQLTPVVKLTTTTTIRHSWKRLKHSQCMIIHWESKTRSGGALIEEMLDVDPSYDVSNKIIVLTTNPIHEDVVYFSELGIRRIVRLRNRDKELDATKVELCQHIKEATEQHPKTTIDGLWRKLLIAIDRLPDEPKPELLDHIEANIGKLQGTNKTGARELDALASLKFKRNLKDEAFGLWEQCLLANPNYFRAYNNMISANRLLGQHQEAYSLMQKMQLLNRSRISRLVSMGENQLELKDDRKAEHYFKGALDKDPWSSGALNGMADLRFRKGDLDGARDFLEKSAQSYKFAAILNLQGIDLVRQGRYADALELYSKAQYVLPHQEKGAQLFYNIGLCYSRWNKPNMAQEFLKLALIKEPNYKKAQRLLENIHQHAALNEGMNSVEPEQKESA